MVKFNQNAWLKPYSDMNTTKKAKKLVLKTIFFKLMNNVLENMMKNVREHRDIKLVTTERRTNYLVLEPNDHITKFFTEHLLVIKMKKRRYL